MTDHAHLPDDIERADHVTLQTCDCGTLHVVLRRADGEPIAIAPFRFEAVLGVATGMLDAVDQQVARRTGGVH